jgi:hypothetical protein
MSDVIQSYPATDPFANIEALRIANPVAAIRVVTETVSIRVGRPDKRRFFRVRDGADWELDCAILEPSKEDGAFLVLGDCLQELESELSFVKLVLCMTRDGEISLWPLKLPGPDGRTNRWSESAMVAADIARHAWIRLVSNLSAGCYVVQRPELELEAPVWPDKPFLHYLKLAFRDRTIQNMDHPVVRKLLGAA